MISTQMYGPPWDTRTSGAARCVNTERPLTHPLDSTEEGLAMQATRRSDADSVDRFWSKVDRRGPDECWPWLGTVLTAGYGQFRFPSERRLAHRAAYELLVGPIPEGLTLDHLCCVKTCVNPSHLEPVTAEVNFRRAVDAGLMSQNGDWQRIKTHCPQDHPYDETNTYVTPRGSRGCRMCRSAAKARSRSRKKSLA